MFAKVVIFCAALAAAHGSALFASPLVNTGVSVESRQQDSLGNYAYAYDIKDAATGSINSKAEVGKALAVAAPAYAAHGYAAPAYAAHGYAAPAYAARAYAAPAYAAHGYAAPAYAARAYAAPLAYAAPAVAAPIAYGGVVGHSGVLGLGYGVGLGHGAALGHGYGAAVLGAGLGKVLI
ncbi:hypothetical protein AVEN_42306-1 [Araneus ventricosus]|uniref:Uncharacterized protein n=1 Tax=Araneus ventricosus TaxID=182803 RepID=A0A4Y2MMV1_ARAVE|nr:hypothetical protein AVEN_42306-1 [Araneus ventricosus]